MHDEIKKLKIKAKHYIEYTKDGITDKFHEGDKVICRTADKEHTGTITCVGEFKENEEAEPVTVICLTLNTYTHLQFEDALEEMKKVVG